MKRILVFLIVTALVMSLSTLAGAVEKKEKKADEKKQPSSQAANQKKAATAEADKKKYDSFVDNNKNGIDDRSENLKPKPTPAKPAAAKKTERKPVVTPAKGDAKKADTTGKKPN